MCDVAFSGCMIGRRYAGTGTYGTYSTFNYLACQLKLPSAHTLTFM